MPRVRPFGRNKPKRVVGRKIIVACEGKKTERGYFEAMRKSLRLPTLQVEVVHPDATDPLSIVRAAIRLRQNRVHDRAWTQGDSAWAVFDGDEHKDANPDNWNDALQIAKSKQIHLAISNPSFEFWYLLHYGTVMAQLARAEALRRLLQHIPHYQKGLVLWPELQPLTQDAITRARRLKERAITDGLDPFTNPCSSVYELVESILTLREETGPGA
jgi:hypothetical protein